MSDNVKVSTFEQLDFTHSQPTAVTTEVIHVQINANEIMGNYAKAVVAEVNRVAPLTAEQVNLTAEEVLRYSTYLLYQRVLCVHDECKDYRKLKLLYIPVWIQYNMSLVGEVTIRDRGLVLIPVMDEPDMTFDEALEISNKLAAFERVIQLVKDAMPRSSEGSRDLMTTALIAGYVRSMDKVQHVAYTYATAFLGMKIREEAAMQVLYRIQYDDLDYIAMALSSERRIIGSAGT